MALMVVCGVLVVAGLAAVVRWGGLDVEAPEAAGGWGEQSSPWKVVARRYVWNVTVAVAAGIGAGVLMAGAGGRLAMRLLAATAGEAAQGRVTEADQVVGRISAGGTVDFVVFTALFFGPATGAAYMVLRRWLPPGRLGGLAIGALLLVVASTRIEPLRGDNPDFDIVGPGWVSILVFGALVLGHGMLVAALAARYSRALPLLAPRWRSLLAYAPLLLVIPVAPVLLPVAIVGLVVVAASRARPVVELVRSRAFVVAGRAVLAAAALAALPGFVSTVADILGRGP